jgi:hypothetical protein
MCAGKLSCSEIDAPHQQSFQKLISSPSPRSHAELSIATANSFFHFLFIYIFEKKTMGGKVRPLIFLSPLSNQIKLKEK